MSYTLTSMLTMKIIFKQNIKIIIYVQKRTPNRCYFKAKIVSCGQHPYSVALFVIKAIKKIWSTSWPWKRFMAWNKVIINMKQRISNRCEFKANVAGYTQHPCSIAPPLIASHSLEKGLTSIVALKRVYDIIAQNNKVIITIHAHSQ